ncbi:hypothetical protein [Methylorubrum suomiense]|uniref:HeH/LEM domain-containing protein n=1 Tax=Methylorubrum suomiense TaxID=144191 RepID=A0ABQ4UYU5_9HYPH|nr:hypothetical protein [Methylorubrum suomiense]GJE77278.1 hypothetical protein BGCPKDLD_3881 [Methylorubrum suomiense]
MSKLTNRFTAPLGLPDGRIVYPGATVEDVPAKDLDHPVMKARIEAGHLAKGESAAKEAAKAPQLSTMTDDELRTLLKSKDVTVDGRWGRDKLLAEAAKVQAPA